MCKDLELPDDCEETPEIARVEGQFERIVILEQALNTLREMKDVQCSDGNWNCNSYMHGMANGMIFAISLFDDKPPEYLKAPETWIADAVVAEEK